MLPSHSHSIAELTGSFPPTPRFELRHCLGAGGFGIVYEAYDREFNDVVALKALRRGGPGSHYSFKKEFRALGDIIHPNLIALYELIVGGDQCFFTMELVRGKHFLQYVREFNSLNTAAATLDAWPPQRLLSPAGRRSLCAPSSGKTPLRPEALECPSRRSRTSSNSRLRADYLKRFSRNPREAARLGRHSSVYVTRTT